MTNDEKLVIANLLTAIHEDQIAHGFDHLAVLSAAAEKRRQEAHERLIQAMAAAQALCIIRLDTGLPPEMWP
jgi:hypothetical protein